ncbi:MAG: CYTH domain-containing protein [Chlamydiae bacterium]|nr:CYTH domain-containing protein [Chlamydiota bacterium]
MIEVERKFCLDPKGLEQIKKNGEFIDKKTISDVYYDDVQFSLTTKNIWLRKRNNRFELKVGMTQKRERLDVYQEILTEEEILTHLNLGKGPLESLLKNKKIIPFCEMKTTREKYKIRKFIIDIDEAHIEDFIYRLAEIELLVDTKEQVEQAKEEILLFSQSLGIHANKVEPGKLIAFLAHKRKEHYKALLEAGVISSV